MPRNTFIGKTVHDLYPNDPEVAKRLHADDQVLWNHPGSQHYETSITTSDGKPHDTIYYKATFTHTDGSVAGLIGTIVDISERKDLERRFEPTFTTRRLESCTPARRRILLANKILDMTGYSLSELQQMPAAGLSHRRTSPATRISNSNCWRARLTPSCRRNVTSASTAR